ncbi:MAG: transcriptional repressor [Armatimonadota bacterium]|nr:transcriptional repressor [Armatimonadota bacterium]
MPGIRRPLRQRDTWQRQAILEAMADAPCHLTAEELHRRLRRRRRPIGLATVYRALGLFVQEGLVEPAHVGDGRVRYGLAARHHDHVVCLVCGAWRSINGCPVPAIPRRLAGFEITGHQLEMFGYCARCRSFLGRGRLVRDAQRSRQVGVPAR